jgi:hypothetical protein
MSNKSLPSLHTYGVIPVLMYQNVYKCDGNKRRRGNGCCPKCPPFSNNNNNTEHRILHLARAVPPGRARTGTKIRFATGKKPR